MGAWLRQNRYYLLVAVALAAAAALFIVFVTPDWAWHPLGYCSGTASQVKNCKGYNFYSGIGANLQEVTLFVAIAIFWLKHNCYEHGCPWVGRVKGDDGHLRCKGHHRALYRSYGKSDPS